MGISVERADDGRQLAEFVDLPFSLHEPSSPWVPNLKSEDRALLDPASHPFWENATRQLFIARDNGVPVGRVAAIIDSKYNDYAHEKCGAFGFFECVNDRAPAHALLDAARNWLCERGMTYMRGPLNPSTNYSCGLLVDGFELPPAIMMPWNPPWYAELFETWPLRKEQDLLAYLIERDNLSLPQWLKEEVKKVKAEGRFTFRSSSKATLAEDIRAMLDIYRESWAENWGFSPLSPEEAARHVRELKSILDPDFFVLFFHDGKPAAGMVALPDMNPLLKRLNGRIGISAPWHYLRSRRQIRGGYRIMLFGILPQYRLYGLPLLLLDYMLEKARSRPDFRWVEGSWVLEDNAAIDDLIEDFGGRITKRYRIYRREIAPC